MHVKLDAPTRTLFQIEDVYLIRTPLTGVPSIHHYFVLEVHAAAALLLFGSVGGTVRWQFPTQKRTRIDLVHGVDVVARQSVASE